MRAGKTSAVGSCVWPMRGTARTKSDPNKRSHLAVYHAACMHVHPLVTHCHTGQCLFLSALVNGMVGHSLSCRDMETIMAVGFRPAREHADAKRRFSTTNDAAGGTGWIPFVPHIAEGGHSGPPIQIWPSAVSQHHIENDHHFGARGPSRGRGPVRHRRERDRSRKCSVGDAQSLPRRGASAYCWNDPSTILMRGSNQGAVSGPAMVRIL